MDDEAGKADSASNSVVMHREPPPSLGMVAHIWAGHVGPTELDTTEPPADVVAPGAAGPPPGTATITLPSAESHPAAVD
jgi:hypothetical protein